MKHVNALVAVALVLGGGTVQAGLINAGFEDPLTVGPWIKSPGTSSAVEVLTSTSTGLGVSLYQPTERLQFLKIASGTALQNVWQTVTQTAFFTQGELLQGYAAFDWGDNTPYIDGARVRIFQGTAVSPSYENIPFYRTGASFPITTYPPYPGSSPSNPYSNFYNGPWTLWSWVAPSAGLFTVEYGAVNAVVNGFAFDRSGSSWGLFDTVTAVPEPASLSLFVIGLAGLSHMQRRRNVSLCRPS